MSYRITIRNGQPTVETDSTEEAHAFLNHLNESPKLVQHLLPRQLKSTKRTTYRTIAKTSQPWTRSEILTVLDHLNEPAKLITRLVPTHTEQATEAFVYNIRKGRKQSKKARVIINEWKQEHQV